MEKKSCCTYKRFSPERTIIVVTLLLLNYSPAMSSKSLYPYPECLFDVIIASSCRRIIIILLSLFHTHARTRTHIHHNNIISIILYVFFFFIRINDHTSRILFRFRYYYFILLTFFFFRHKPLRGIFS